MVMSVSARFFASTVALVAMIAITALEGPEALDSFVACLPSNKLVAPLLIGIGSIFLLAYVAEIGILLLWWARVAGTHRQRYRASAISFFDFELPNPLMRIAASNDMDAEAVKDFIRRCGQQPDGKASYLNVMRLAGLGSILFFATCSSCNTGASGCSLEPLAPLGMGMLPTFSAMMRAQFPDDWLLRKYGSL